VLHLGTLVALLAYLARLAAPGAGGLATIRDRSFRGDPDRKLAWLIVVTMPPAIVAGMLLNDFFEQEVRQPVLVAVMLVIGAGILWTADRLGRRADGMERVGWGGAIFVGCAQAVALVPGISRSGISISAGLALGLTREAAARFSFLMAAPIIAGAGAWETRKLLTGEAGVPVEVGPLVAGFVASLVSGFAAIVWLLRYLRSNPMTIFVGYRVVLAAIVIVFFLNV
jgi:undecaprenyl-diphosphatase